MTPDVNPDRTPTNNRRALGLVAGAVTAAAIYGAEGYISYIMLETLRAAFQSPDTFTSTVGILGVLGVLGMLIYNRGEFPQAVLTSGIRASQAVYKTILSS